MSDDILARLAAVDAEPDTEVEVEATPGVEETDLTPAEPAAEAPVEEEAKLYAGKYKSPEDLEAAYSHAERKMHEATRQAREYEQMLAAQQQQAIQQQQAAFSGVPQSLEDLQVLAYEQPEAAVEFAALQAPHTMPHVLAAISQVDPTRAEVLREWYHEYKLEQRLEAASAPLREIQNQTVAKTAWQAIADRPGYAELREDIANIVAEKAHWFETDNPNQLAAALSDAFEIASARNPGKVAQVAQRAAAVRQAAAATHVEAGGHGVAEVEAETTPEDDIRNSIFKHASETAW